LKKIEKVMTRLTRSKIWLQPVDFYIFFLLKRRRFDFLKIGIDPGDPMTRSKPGTRALDRAEFKNYVFL
jgi:hypothetical protein